MQDFQLRKRIASLSPDERQKVLQKLKERKQKSGSASTESPIGKAQPIRIEPDTGARIYPAAPAQERMYFLHEFTGRSITYSTNACFHLSGSLDISRLEGAFTSLVARHDSLRTRFSMENDKLWQCILPNGDFAIQHYNAGGSTPQERKQAAMEIVNRLADTPFDLTSGSLIRVALVRVEDNAFYLVIQSHHIISDGWSFNILMREISEFYNASVNGTAPKLDNLEIQLADFSQWQIERLNSGAWEDSFSYWTENLKNEPGPLEFPWDYERKVNQEPMGGTLFRPLDPEQFEELSILANRQKATLFMVLLTAFKLHLLQHTGETDLIVGVPIANRLRKESEPIVGCLINTLALRTDCSGNPTFATLLDRVRSTSLNAFPHQELPFDRVIKRLDVKRHPGRPPLFQTHFTLQNFPPAVLDLQEIKASRINLSHERSKFDYSIAVERFQDGWRSKIDFNREVFKEETAGKMADSWHALLRRVIHGQENRVSSLLGRSEASRPVTFSKSLPEARCIHERFEAQVIKTPEANAVQCGAATLCFRELNERANQLAHCLLDKGITCDSVVGISTHRSFEMIIAILGILKAGGAYLPMDPDWPEKRKAQIIGDSRLDTIITVKGFSRQFKDFKGTLVCLDNPDVLAPYGTSNPQQPVTPGQLAYILYTSGSTGSPKGVMVEHRHLDNYLNGLMDTIALGPGNYAMAQPLTADASQTMLLPPLVLGGCLHLISLDRSLSPKKLSQYFKRNQIDYFKATPTHLSALLDVFPSPDLFPGKILIIGGEALPVSLVRMIRKLNPGCRIWNHYGPTETTVGVLAREVSLQIEDLDDAGDSIPIGKPFPGVDVHILDKSGNPVPPGETGEIHISGRTLARGYLNDPDRTRQVFIPNHLDSTPNERLYRTGDRGWFLQDGSVQFGGRLDDQVKISGYRIEPGEIESVLREHPGVEKSVVLHDKDASGATCLLAFIVSRKGDSPAPEMLREFLRKRLPEAMVPAKFELVDRIPMTPMGKTDRKALLSRLSLQKEPEASPKPARSARKGSLDVLLDTCRELLGLQTIEKEQSFFELGGTSLAAMRLAGRISDSLGLDIPIRLLFDTGSLRELAIAIDDLESPQPNKAAQSAPDFGSVHLLFEKQVRLHPELVAVEHSGEALTYAELNQASNRLAHHLRELGVGPDILVAVYLERSIEMIVAVLAIFKAGGTCLPVDLKNPDKRTQAIFQDADPAIVLCNDESSSHLYPPGIRSIIPGNLELMGTGFENPRCINSGEDLAYVLYTSGSTGAPKGVQVPHRTLDNLIRWQLGDSVCVEGDKTLQFAALSFDVSFQEIFLTLAEGGQLVLLDEENRIDIPALLSVISKASISRLFLPYVALDAIATEAQQSGLELPGLLEVITAGEQLKITSAIRSFFVRHGKTVLKNQYGPTETHVVTSYTLRGNPLDWPNLPAIGTPVANTKIYLLDDQLNPVPDGAEGEIYVGGTPVSRGYLNLDALTRDKFIECAGRPGERIYKTGDRAWRREDGSYQFLGRIDQQIKFRGYRIELSEIESKLMEHPGIRECAVVLRDPGKSHQQLVAFIVPLQDIMPDPIREFLHDYLPEYMIPSGYEFVDKLPLNRNGKIDRQTLARRLIAEKPVSMADVPNGKSTQEIIQRIWMDILEIPQVSPGDNFFKIGGHSLLATKVVSRIKNQLSPDCSIRMLFEHPILEDLSQNVDAMLRQAKGMPVTALPASPAGKDSSTRAFPASYAQQRLWFIDQFEGGSQHYLIPLQYVLKGNLDLNALEGALNAIVARHQTLRTHFEENDGIVYQVIHDKVHIDLTGTIKDAPVGQSPGEAAQLALAEERRLAFDLSRAPLFRANIVRIQSDVHVLLVIFHHVISDGWSNGVFRRELCHYYNSISKGRHPDLAPLSMHYSEYAEWQQDWLQGQRLEEQKSFWKSYLQGSSELTLPMDFPRPDVLSYKGGRIRFTLSGKLSAQLRKFNLAARTTPFMTLMAAFQVMLSRYSGQTDISVGTPIANRRRVEFEKLIGFFVNTLVIRTDLSGDPGFSKVVARVKDSALDAFAHQDFPFEKMVECLNPQRHMNKHPLFQVLFALQNTPGDPLSLEGIDVESLPSPGLSTHFDLEMHLFQEGDQWSGSLSYSSDLFKAETIRKMAHAFPLLLEQLLSTPHQSVWAVDGHEQGNLSLHTREDATQPAPAETTLMEPPPYEYVAPTTPIEKGICGIWEEILGMNRIGVLDNFFDIGGHSLLANQMTIRVHSLVDRPVSLKAFFQNPTIRGLVDTFASPESIEIASLPGKPKGKLETFPLSFIQQRIWFMEHFDEGSCQYHMPLLFRLQGPLEYDSLEKAINTIIERHAPLRTGFRDEGDQVVQVVYPDIQVSLETQRLLIEPGVSLEDTVREAAATACTQPFSLEEAPLLRARLFAVGDQDHVLVLVFHHIIFDGWSVDLFLSELHRLYPAFLSGMDNPLQPLPLEFGNWVTRQRSLMDNKGSLDRLEQFWKNFLKDAPKVSTFPTERPRSLSHGNHSGVVEQVLDNRLASTLALFARKNKTTLFPVLLSAFSVLLSRHSGQRDLVIGTPTSGRDDADVGSLIGCFLGTLAIRSKPDPDTSFRQFMREVFLTVLNCFEHQKLPFEKLVEVLNPERSQRYSPVFQILFNYLDSSFNGLELEGLETESMKLPCVAAKYDLTLYVRKSGPEVSLKAVFNNDLYSHEMVSHWLDQYEHLLGQILEDPDKQLRDYSLVSPRGQSLLVDPGIELEEPQFLPVTRQFMNIANSTPSRVAIIQDEHEWTYSALEACSGAIAASLVAQGLQAGEVVSVSGLRCFGLIAAIIGILRARGAFLVLDRDLPILRQLKMLEESRATWMISINEPTTASTPLECDIPKSHRLSISTDGTLLFSGETSRLDIEDPAPGSRAYIFFTSGTTGTPKGIAGNHKGLSHFIEWERQKLELTESDRVANLTGFSFDVILRDIFVPLTSGATLCIPGSGFKANDSRSIEWLAKNRISILHTVPSVLHAWIDSLFTEIQLPDLRYALVAGEPLQDFLVRNWRTHFGNTCRFLNLYGTTETTLAKSFYEVPDEPIPGIQPVGIPLPQTQLIILDSNKRQCGIGEPGEIVIRTPFRTSGYIGTNTSPNGGFQNNPFRDDPSDLVYFTGDTGHLGPDGLVRIAGRMDDQVKIHGVRIEPAEIAVILSKHPAVSRAVVIPRSENSGQFILAAYFIREKSEETVSGVTLRAFLKSQLPEYMIPAFFIQLDSIPLNQNGKLDRKALPSPDPDYNLSFAKYCPARSLLEASLANIWQTVLGIEKISIHDDFFHIGGHSLLATRIVSRIQGEIYHDTPLRCLFDCRTIESLARQIRKWQTAGSVDEYDSASGSDTRSCPASFAQQRLWFLDRLSQEMSPYLMGGSLQLTGNLDYAALQLAVDAIIRRHESFRTSFEMIDGDPFQSIAPALDVQIAFHDLSSLDSSIESEAIRNAVQCQMDEPFSLDELPLVRFSLFRIEENRHIFSWRCHHIISDGWSVNLFNKELKAYYAGFLHKKPYNPPRLEAQYADFSQWQHERLRSGNLDRQISYWREQLSEPPVLDLPGSFVRPPRQSFKGARQRFRLPGDLSRKLDAFDAANNSTAFMTLMGAFQLLLSRYTGQNDIITGTPIANRNEVAYENVIGFFVNTLALRTDLSGNPSFSELITRVRETAIDAFDNQDVPFETLVKELNPVRDASRHPLFQFIFALQNTTTERPSLEDLDVKPYPLGGTTTRFDLELHMSAGDQGYEGILNYCTGLFSTEFIECLIGRFIRLLDFSLSSPQRPIGDWCLAGPDEIRKVLVEWNQTSRDCQLDMPVHGHFSLQAKQSPQAIALEQDAQAMTYATLEQRSNQLAHFLLNRDLAKGDRIGVCLDRSIDFVIAILAVLKAGGVYVPLSKDYPPARLQVMKKSAAISCILHTGMLPGGLDGKDQQTFDLEACAGDISREPEHAPTVSVSGEDPAYVIFTSGSTGQPKGAVIPHRGIVRLVSAQDFADFSREETFLFLASPAFDASTFEIWAPLLNGSTCAIFNPGPLDIMELEAAIIRHRVNAIWLTAGLFNMIVDTHPALLGHLKHVLTGGEALSPTHVRKALSLYPQLKLTNGYGPTEATTFACTNEVRPDDLRLNSIPIGRPIANTQAYLVDQYMQPVPPGIPGELLLGGAGLAIGYINDPDLTCDKFVTRSLGDLPETRLYRTGDICRHLKDGRLDFIGRNDNQIKIRGFRIELGEIEAACLKHPGVMRTIIVPQKDPASTFRLIGYYVPSSEEAGPEPDQLRTFLGSILPDYAIPAFLCRLPELPLNANGKVDLKALPDPASGSPVSKKSDRSTLTPMEEKLIAVWKELFGRDSISPLDNFFDLGGHSLLAAKMLSKVEPLVGKALPVAILFESPSIRDLAVRIEENQRIRISSSLVVLQSEGQKNPLYCVHGWGGDVYGFLDLARHLAPERPVYGLQALGLDGTTPKHATVEEMAAHYAREISRNHDDRPINLIGYSAGGWIAYAVAQELQLMGKPVNLAMLDTGMSSRIPYWMYFLTKLAHLTCRIPHHLKKWWQQPGRRKLNYLLERCRWLRVGITRNTDKLPTQQETDGSEKAYENDYFIAVAGRYKPSPYKGDLILFSAKGRRWYSHLFWKFMIRGAVDIHFVEGDHHGIIDRYHVGNFSQLFKEVLETLDNSSKDRRS